MTESCAGRTADFGALRWFEVDGAFVRSNAMVLSGLWSPTAHAIAVGRDNKRFGALIRHEMLHAILGVSGHPRGAFLESCASLVLCDENCAKEAGAWHAAEPFAVVSSDSVSIETEVRAEPQEADGEHWITLRAVVRNPTSRALFVKGVYYPDVPNGFGFGFRGPTGGLEQSELASDSSRFFFGPFETKAFVFDFVGGDTLSTTTLLPGDYLVRAGYAQRFGEYERITVVK